jgi:TPR repeat protein
LPDFFADDLVQESPRLNRAFAAGIIGLALAIILAALLLSFRSDVGAALIYLGEKLAGEEHKPAATRQPVFNIAPPQTAQSNAARAEKNADKPAPSLDAPAVSQPQSSATSAEPSDANATNGNALSSSPVSPGGVQKVQDLPLPPDSGTGQKEFEQARTILKGNHRHRDLSSAVDLLWISVGKGHVPAEVTLADLYARGDGVAKSCVQARTLLEAAVRKGSPEGLLRLDQLKRRGCR